MMHDGVSQISIRQGVLWSVIGQFSGRTINFLSMLVLARLLTPADYGLFGLASAAVAFASLLGDLGLGAALIQRQGNDRANASAAFYLNLAVVFFAGSALALIAPWVARYYGEPALRGILLLVICGFVVRGSTAIHEAYLRKTMQFGRLQAVSLAATLLYAAVSVALAWRGFGAWSLAIGSAASALITACLMWLSSPLPLSRHLHRDRWRDLVGFGRYVLFASLLWYVVLNGDNLAVGKVLGTSALGFYALAYNYGRLPQILAGNAVEDVLFSAFSRVQNDSRQVKDWLIRSFSLLALTATPVSILMLIAGRDLLLAALGGKWAPAGVPFTIFSSVFSLVMIAAPFPPLYRAMNRPQLQFYLALPTVPVFAAAVALGLRYGAVGVAAAVASTMLLLTFLQVPLAASLVQARWTELISGMTAPLVTASLAGSLTFGGQYLGWAPLPPAARLAISATAFVGLYVTCLKWLYPVSWAQLKRFIRFRSVS